MSGVSDFGEKLKQLREAAGKTQKQLAETAGLTREGIAQLETGRRKPAWDTLQALAKALDVTLDTFHAPLAGETPPRKPGRPKKT